MSICVELDAVTAQAVEALARQQQRSADAVVRDAVSAYVRGVQRELSPGMGQYRSGRSDVSSRVDELLQQAVEERQWP